MIEIWISGRAVGKARPRLSRYGVHTPTRYAEWKRNTILQLMALKLPPAPIPAKVDCFFVNFLSSDTDNLTGALLDSLVEAGVLKNDSSSFVASSSGTFVKTCKKRGRDKPLGVLVQIAPMQVELLDLDIVANLHSVA